MIHVRECARNDPKYEAFAGTAPQATAYHDPRWLNAVERAFRLPCFRLLAERDGNPIGMLPLTHVKSMLFGNFLVSTAFGNFGGIVTTDDEARAELLQSAIELARARNAKWIELRHVDTLPLPLEEHTRKVNQYLELPADPDALWNKVASKLRQQTRKAEKDGVECNIGGRENLPPFVDVFSRLIHDLGTPVYSSGFFDALFDELGDAVRIAVVRRGETVLGSIFLMSHREQIESIWGGTLHEFNSTHANTLMYWNCFRHAIQQGFKRFDFGTADQGSGVYQFKQRWGAVERPLHRQYWLAPGQEMPHLNPSNPRYAAKIRMWRKLPLWLTKIVGPMLARKLP